MTIEEASNGFGRLLPHTVFQITEEGLPSGNLLEIRSEAVLFNNVGDSNPVLPVTQWPADTELPNGNEGNHFLYARFRQPIDVSSVLDAAASSAPNANLIGTISVLAVDPVSMTTLPIPGRAFIGGRTYGQPDPENPGLLRLEEWVVNDGNGKPTAVAVDGYAGLPGLGFPATEDLASFAGANLLTDPRTFVFIPDADGDLSTHETFPTGVQIRMRLTSGVMSIRGDELQEEGLASSTVAGDDVSPEVSISGAQQTPTIIPGNGDENIDPGTNVFVEFTEPVQPLSVGPFDTGVPPLPSSAIQLVFGPDTSTVSVPFYARPVSVFDLSRYELTPAYTFPGAAPEGLSSGLACGSFSQVDVVVNESQVEDLAGNFNALTPETFFTTGEGPGLVNAPVTPDAIYVARQSPDISLSVIDLNGFGASTGNPIPAWPSGGVPMEGGTNYPNNPNVLLQGSLVCPQLAPGNCTFNGGSSGVFTLTRDSSLDDRLLRSPQVFSIADMALGHTLDTSFNASQPFGCQSGGGNLCAATGLKNLVIFPGSVNTVAPTGQTPIEQTPGAPNTVSWAPHPNPPPLVFPPLCLSPLIGGQEPTSIVTTTPAPAGKGLPHLLVPGANILGNPNVDPPIAPSAILASEQNQWILGPSLPQQNLTACLPYMVRQQIGNFLYLCDRIAQEVVVVNSNRMTVLERISLPDPTSFAMSPNLDYLAVSSQESNSVFFIDTDPNSATFHEVVESVQVGVGPTGIAWEPGNEDILVCNTLENSVSVISAFSFQVRNTAISQLFQPIEVAITPRQTNHGLQRGVYFGYILNANGRVSIYESGPAGLNGIGFDTVVGQPSFIFNNAKTIHADVTSLNSGVWIAHEDQLDENGQLTGLFGGAISKMAQLSGTVGPVPLGGGFFTLPGLRDIQYSIIASVGSDQLTGIPVDLAFDNLRNLAVLQTQFSQFSSGFPTLTNGKGMVKTQQAGPTLATTPQFMFAACPSSPEGAGNGAVDVIDLVSGFSRVDTSSFRDGINSIDVAQPRVMMDYFRQ